MKILIFLKLIIYNSNGCNRGFSFQAWRYFNKNGIVSGGSYGDTSKCNSYPFKKCDHYWSGQYGPCIDINPTPECVKQCTNNTYDYINDKIYFDKPYYLENNVEIIQTELMTNGPLEVVFDVFEDLTLYLDGIYQHEFGHNLGSFSGKLVGWGVEYGIKYWKVANNWNEQWGENGYFRIIRGVDECGIENSVIGGMPILK